MANENLVTVPLQFEAAQLFAMRPIIRDQLTTTKNHIASFVENGDYARAKTQVEYLREIEECHKRINRALHAITGKYD